MHYTSEHCRCTEKTSSRLIKIISGSNILFPLIRLIVKAPLLVIAGCYLNKEIRNDMTNIGKFYGNYGVGH